MVLDIETIRKGMCGVVHLLLPRISSWKQVPAKLFNSDTQKCLESYYSVLFC